MLILYRKNLNIIKVVVCKIQDQEESLVMWNIVQRILLELLIYFILNLFVYMLMIVIKYEVVYQIFQNFIDKFVLYILQCVEKSIEQEKYI